MASLWVKSSSGQHTDETGDDENEDIWDDTALIQAYDRAVSSFKNGPKFRNGKDDTSPNQRTKKKKRNKPNKDNNATKENYWKIGDKCQAVYNEDGLLYMATIIDVDMKKRSGVVRFDYYENIETVSFDDIYDENLSREETRNANQEMDVNKKRPENDFSDQWNIGDVCRAFNPKSRKHEEAVIIGLSNDKCDLTFIKSKMKQTIKLSSIRDAKSSQQTNYCTCNHHKSREEERNFLHQNMFSYFGSPTHPMSSEPYMPQPPIPTPFPFPSFPPSPYHGFPHYQNNTPFSKRFNPLVPPPPPPLPFPCEIEDGDESALANMLMSWYMVGYHTGFFQAMKRDGGKQETSEFSDSKMKDDESTSIDNSNNSD